MYGDIGTFLKDFHDAMFLCGMRIVLGRFRVLIPKKKLEKACASPHSFLNFYIDKAVTQKGTASADDTASSMIKGLVEQTEDRIEIRNQTLQVLMASSDTISILLSNTVLLLAQHPSIWKQIRDEVLSKGQDLFAIESLNAPGILRNSLYEGELT